MKTIFMTAYHMHKKNSTVQTYQKLHNYTHESLTFNRKLLRMTAFTHRSESVQKYIPLSWITFPPG